MSGNSNPTRHPPGTTATPATIAAWGSAECDWLRALDAISEPVFIHDEHYRILAANRAYAERAGLTPEEFRQRPYWEVFPHGDGPLPSCRAAMDQGGCGQHRNHRGEITEELALPSGEVFISRSFAVTDATGHYKQSVHILEDVTEQRRREHRLSVAESRAREREHQLDRVLSNTAEGILVVDEHGRIVYANATAGTLTGHSPAELIGQDFGFPVATGSPAEIELHTSGNGNRIVEMRARTMRWEGKPAFVLNLHDVTERKRVERELRQAAIVFEEAREGVIITDAEANIVAVNHAFTQITGYDEDQALGCNPRFLASGFHTPAFYQAMWEAIRSHGYWTGEIWNRRNDGTTFAELATIRELRDESGRPTHYIGVFSDISRIKEYQTQLERVLHLDPLTELPNRLLFHDRLEQALRQHQRQRTNENAVAVLVVDLSDFRAVNDSLGHAIGDRTLRIVGERLDSAMGDSATVARLSGDEFGVLLPQLATADDAASAAERLIEAAEAPLEIDGHQIPITLRVGLSTFPDQAQGANVLLEQADAAMYEAKSEGVSYRFFSEELTERARERIELGAELRQALAGEELALHFQPQVDLDSGRWIGLEALLRWPHPRRGPISPGRFIPVAERTGLMCQLGAWVLQRACRQYQTLLDAGQDWGRLAINITAPELADPTFVERVMRTLEETGLAAERLELEITESLLVNTDERIIERLDALRRHGVRVAVDDFGTGYSALSYLKDLPVDRLKIDRSFIDNVDQPSRGATITRAILALGQSLELEVIAEGIETEAQRRTLQEAGCLQGQGFFLARPAPLEQLRPPDPAP
ncbi:sensor domain-containing protein [Halorhodospira halophila]|uniref:cyclic-guanylate-specific phosphodiesterase n=1 Tax=Halorhodospira halophila (strain DSM 244 / SL1) TaxID=349124 RepID=A1WTX5_HALHL|nr:EAL domain-containing protein [Halorhodospira halophila]ABM61137.1 diguanylate cyclase/phosphodiesterase with PAS/PAC sensor(s) [Halorhodospira halophila SL1]MBK1729669.1 GGDEF domain-containing protein [Halorhodospira halophila]